MWARWDPTPATQSNCLYTILKVFFTYRGSLRFLTGTSTRKKTRGYRQVPIEVRLESVLSGRVCAVSVALLVAMSHGRQAESQCSMCYTCKRVSRRENTGCFWIFFILLWLLINCSEGRQAARLGGQVLRVTLRALRNSSTAYGALMDGCVCFAVLCFHCPHLY